MPFKEEKMIMSRKYVEMSKEKSERMIAGMCYFKQRRQRKNSKNFG